MEQLKGFQKKYLRGVAHSLKPVVLIGQHGVTDAVIKSIEEALYTHELIKIKFNEFKEKNQKKELIEKIENKTLCEIAGVIGHTAILYKQQQDTEKRNIKIPSK